MREGSSRTKARTTYLPGSTTYLLPICVLTPIVVSYVRVAGLVVSICL